jgi:hypothetical protein
VGHPRVWLCNLRQLYNSGADPVSIRAAIEKKWTPQYRTKTPTPPVPPKKR